MKYTTRDVAERLGIPYQTLASALWNGRVKEPAVKIGRKRLWSEAEVEALKKVFVTKEEVK